MLIFFLPERKETQSNTRLQESTLNKDQNKHIPLKVVWNTLTDVYKWPHFIATACVFSTWNPLTTYTPSIIMSLGFSRIESNALAAIGSFLTLPVVIFFAWLSDKTNKRGLTVMISIETYLIALIILKTVQPHMGKWGRFGLWTTVNGLAVGYHPIHNAWIQVNCKSPEERSISIA